MQRTSFDALSTALLADMGGERGTGRSADHRSDRDRGDRGERGERGRAPIRRAAGRAFGKSLGKWIGIGVVGALLATVVLPSLLSRLPNPFATETIDRTEPAILQAITDLHRYEAASATLEVVVDIEKDAKYLPDAIRGERRIFLAHGTVGAGVEFADIATTIHVDEATKSVTIAIPHAHLVNTHIDLDRSKMLEHNRGLLDRLGSAMGGAPASDKDLLRIAERKLEAAAQESGVLHQADENTKAMLTQLATGLGYKNVTVVFGDAKFGPPVPGAAVATTNPL
jgi:hypothetical protein